MTPFLTSLLFGAGVAGWVWSQVSRRTGSADPSSVTLTAIGAGFVAFLIFFTLMKFVFNL